ncbi:MAG TPA: cytidylate kinase-like family protein [Syntrophales bacterium]|jgi:cytidylate kinase|nr:cytidylate kinase-like family protein [Syntrophales bacterium]HON22738.1 cytidylate kinase-like family protein [Syntrophales bacterium]HPC33266.1 cytidylate kinase-like family protein [Syntrophales bacterium]HQG34674.1 cytidylate kinase-like family protein [Syntrophales bacterium]HQI36576.1 cytidylate kinase-like family protein [Syntrophales bacterium]
MGIEKRLCIICAWRQHCQKRFSVATDGAVNIHCPDFTRDFTIKDVEEDRQIVEQQLERWRKERPVRAKPCITVSREPGAGGSEIARILAADLKMDLIGGQIISRVAESANMSEKVVKTLDEKNVTKLDSWINSLFTSRHLWPDVYLQHLTKVIGTIGEHGNAIIVGRGAQFILPPDRIFRVRFIAPFDKRVLRVMKNRNCTGAEAEGYIIKTDSDRAAFIKKYFNEDITDPANYDLVVNTAILSCEEAADMVKKAFQSKKFLNNVS